MFIAETAELAETSRRVAEKESGELPLDRLEVSAITASVRFIFLVAVGVPLCAARVGSTDFAGSTGTLRPRRVPGMSFR